MKKLFIVVFILLIQLFTINNVSANTRVSQTKSDIDILPDKYNTGCSKDLELITLNLEEGNLVDDILIIQGSNGTKFVLDFYYRNKDKEGIINIKNKDFSSLGFVCYHEDLVERNIKVIFTNCRFSSCSTGRNPKNISYEFNNCSFNSFYGSNSVLDRCQFGENYTDGIVPFVNVEVKNSFFKDMAGVVTDKGAHTDGTQLYGHKDLDVENIKYTNCRFEIPPLHKEGSAASINACIMLQIEFSNGKNISFNDCYVNGGGYSVYTTSKKEEFTFENVSINNLTFGCAYKHGIFYSKIHPKVMFNNISQADSLFIGSVWKEGNKTHFSVTNDTAKERDLLIYTNKGVYEYKIPACLQINEMTNETEYKDFPFDLDIIIDDDIDYAVCYDNTIKGYAKQIRFVNYTDNNVYLDDDFNNLIFDNSDNILLSGNCGKNVTFTLSKEGILTLSGTGATDNFHSAKSPEWIEYKDFIKEVVVQEGITDLGSMIFRKHFSIEKITLPASLVGIGQYALAACVSLEELTLPNNISSIGKNIISGNITSNVYYYGDNWDLVQIADGNDNLKEKLVLVNDDNNEAPKEDIVPPISEDDKTKEETNDEQIPSLDDNNDQIAENIEKNNNTTNFKDILLVSGLVLIIVIPIIIIIILKRRK